MSAPRGPVTIERLHQPSEDERTVVLALEAGSFSNPWSADTFDRMLESPVARIYVARDRGDIVAFCACYVFEDLLDINTLAVAATRRREGIARRLLQAIFEQTGAPRATLEVRRSNTAALNLYEGLGFVVTASRAKYYENPEDDGLILWLNP